MDLKKTFEYLYLKFKLITINLATFQITNYKTLLQISMVLLILIYLYYLKKNRENEIKEYYKNNITEGFLFGMFKKKEQKTEETKEKYQNLNNDGFLEDQADTIEDTTADSTNLNQLEETDNNTQEQSTTNVEREQQETTQPLQNIFDNNTNKEPEVKPILGPRGFMGPRGEQGKRGITGSVGPIGPKGDKGDKGDRGERGPIGDKGKRGTRGARGYPGQQGAPGTFAENSCKYFGSNSETNWVCPDTHPVYSGGSFGDHNGNLKCNGGVAKNASCGSGKVYGSGGEAVAIVSGGKVVNCAVVNEGHGYLRDPVITFEGGGGAGAKAIAKVVDGKIRNIILVNGGSGYTYQPSIKMEAMPSNQGCNYCHMCCKKPAKPQVLRPDQPGYTEPLDIQIQKNRDLIRSLTDKVNKKLSGLSSMVDATSGLLQPQMMQPVSSTPQITINEDGEQEVVAIINGTPQKLVGQEAIQYIRDSKEAEVISNIARQKRLMGGDQEEEEKIKKSKPGDGDNPLVIGAEQNWALPDYGSEVVMSSEEKGRGAINATDGNKETYASTMEQLNAYIDVELPVNVQINSINVHSKQQETIENFQQTLEEVRRGNIPLRILVFNLEGAVVENKDFNEPTQIFTMENVNVVGKKVRIQLLKKSKLQISNIEILGVAAKTCQNYLNIMAELEPLQLSGGIFKNQKLDGAEAEKLYFKYKKLYDTCNVLPKKEQKNRDISIKRKSAAYEEYIEAELKSRRERVAKARKLLVKIEEQQAKERRIAAIADKYNMEPPRQVYDPAFVDKIKSEANESNLKSPLETLNMNQRAKCYDLMQAYKVKRSDQERRAAKGNKTYNVPLKLAIFPDDRKKLEQIKDRYENECGPFPSSAFQGTLGSYGDDEAVGNVGNADDLGIV